MRQLNLPQGSQFFNAGVVPARRGEDGLQQGRASNRIVEGIMGSQSGTTLFKQWRQSKGRHQVLQFVIRQFWESHACDGEGVNPGPEFLKGE